MPRNWEQTRELPATAASIFNQHGAFIRELVPPAPNQSMPRVLYTCQLCLYNPYTLYQSVMQHSRTTTLWGHVRHKHPAKYQEFKRADADTSDNVTPPSTNNTSQIDRYTVPIRPNTAVTGAKLRELALQLVITQNLPVSFAASSAFRTFITAVEPNIEASALDRPRLNCELQIRYNVQREEFLRRLSLQYDHGGKFSITFDNWTTKSQHAFLGVTIHYINAKWELEAYTLDLIDLKRYQTGEFMAKQLWKCLERFGIQGSIHAITCDNASTKTVCLQQLVPKLRSCSELTFTGPTRCLAHILDLMCEDLLQPIKPTPNRVDTPIPSTRKRARAQMRGQESAPLIDAEPTVGNKNQGHSTLTKLRMTVLKLKTQEKLKQYLVIAQGSNTPVRRPSYDIATRWNSTYHMIDDYVTLEEAINQVVAKYPDDFVDLDISETERNLLLQLSSILRPLNSISVALQRETPPTLQASTLYANKIYSVLRSAQDESNITLELQGSLASALDRLDKYYPRHVSSHHVYESHAVATVLDPRLRFAALTRWGWNPTEIDSFRIRFREIYDDYARQQTTTTTTNTTTITHGSSSSNSSSRRQETHSNISPVLRQLLDDLSDTDEEDTNDEISQYLSDPKVHKSLNPLVYWRDSRFPVLKTMARDYLCIQGTSMPVKRMFTAAEKIGNPRRRNRMTKQRLSQLVCLKSWSDLRSSSSSSSPPPPPENDDDDQDQDQDTSDDTDFED